MMWDFLEGERVILASGSPRRRELLEKVGLRFTVKPIVIDETVDTQLSLEDAVMELSRRKAEAARVGETEGWITAADTIIALDGEAIGKPENREDAVRILRKLSGRQHKVITGFTIMHIPLNRTVSGCQITSVKFYPLSDEEIELYIATGEPMDKAGAYGAQGCGSLLIERIEGCFFNVVGLPLAELRRTWTIFIREINNG
ncbi:MAG: septum formation protein Maf [candidate division Zixibacteria bacterium]|nr:septum formation protein Maf [Candidatus Tariuqbacter arcticus]